MLSRDYPLNEKNLDFWVNEEESPYTEAKRFDWFRGYHVGGRSLMWGRCSFRWSDFDFEANGKDGIAIDWPIRYADIAPWYSHVERFAGIAGSNEGMPQLPDGEFQPPMPLNCAEELVAQRLTKLFDGKRRLISSRTANLTQPLPGRGSCQYRDACWLGCPYGAYFSSQSSTLPAAVKTGRLTLKPFAIATEVLYDPDRKRAICDSSPRHGAATGRSHSAVQYLSMRRLSERMRNSRTGCSEHRLPRHVSPPVPDLA
jgi:choline dehydrogenase-like flavoprotein